MSLICEDGTGKSDSESFISVADAAAYFTARGNTTWAAITTDELREAALRKATEYLTANYRNRWQGSRVYPLTQALDWPRNGVVVDGRGILSTVVPVEVQRSTAELALKASAAELQTDLTQGVVREKVGVIEVEYNNNSPQRTRYALIENILQPFLNAGGGCSVSLVRT